MTDMLEPQRTLRCTLLVAQVCLLVVFGHSHVSWFAASETIPDVYDVVKLTKRFLTDFGTAGTGW